MSPLAALARAHEQSLARTRNLPHLGLPTAARGVAPAGPLPAPKISEITPRTKDQHGIGVAYGGVPTLIAAPVSWPKMRAIAVDLVLAGAHPEDILVWDYDPVRDAITAVRTAVEHMLWTHEDQTRLDEGRYEPKTQID
jgi:hypothetical protein